MHSNCIKDLLNLKEVIIKSIKNLDKAADDNKVLSFAAFLILVEKTLLH